MNEKTDKKLKCMILQCTLNDTALGQELGGVSMQKGDVLVVRSDMGTRILTQYNPRFKQVGTESVESLKHGFYEVRPMTKATEEKQEPKKDEPKKETEKKQGQTRVGVASDRSMGPSKRKGK